MSRVLIIGCGVVGAAIAYELSTVAGLDVTLIDRQSPAQGSTGAALGVLMGVISQKKQGRGWQLRELSLRRYESWIPQLEAETGQSIPFNRDGLVLLTGEQDDMAKWEKLRSRRQSQGWSLEIWDREQLCDRIPHIGEQLACVSRNNENGDHRPNAITGAIYSPHDRQVDPVALTQALVSACQHRGITIYTDVNVQSLSLSRSLQQPHCVHTPQQIFETDWIVIAAGLGTPLLTQPFEPSIDIRPVLGQAIRLHLPSLPETMSEIIPEVMSKTVPRSVPNSVPQSIPGSVHRSRPKSAPRSVLEKATKMMAFNPVIIGHDINIVPICSNEYWVGATVEFPDKAGNIKADDAQLQELLERAIAFYPPLAQGKIISQWSGYRPRPFGQPAPILESFTDHPRAILAAGHYRNGVLLAPATAHWVGNMITTD